MNIRQKTERLKSFAKIVQVMTSSWRIKFQFYFNVIFFSVNTTKYFRINPLINYNTVTKTISYRYLYSKKATFLKIPQIHQIANFFLFLITGSLISNFVIYRQTSYSTNYIQLKLLLINRNSQLYFLSLSTRVLMRSINLLECVQFEWVL